MGLDFSYMFDTFRPEITVYPKMITVQQQQQ